MKDKTCKKCFDENRYLAILKRTGVVIGNSTVYDIASPQGKALLKKYRIAKIPTLVLSASANDYPGFAVSWKQVGSQEKDGWFVFREVQKMGKYKTLVNTP